ATRVELEDRDPLADRELLARAADERGDAGGLGLGVLVRLVEHHGGVRRERSSVHAQRLGIVLGGLEPLQAVVDAPDRNRDQEEDGQAQGAHAGLARAAAHALPPAPAGAAAKPPSGIVGLLPMTRSTTSEGTANSSRRRSGSLVSSARYGATRSSSRRRSSIS